MNVSMLDRCSHPKCGNYSDIASNPCTECDELLDGYPQCGHCGQSGTMM